MPNSTTAALHTMIFNHGATDQSSGAYRVAVGYVPELLYTPLKQYLLRLILTFEICPPKAICEKLLRLINDDNIFDIMPITSHHKPKCVQ